MALAVAESDLSLRYQSQTPLNPRTYLLNDSDRWETFPRDVMHANSAARALRIGHQITVNTFLQCAHYTADP
jgi:hypothetical protein